jgi:hypothetical protein
MEGMGIFRKPFQAFTYKLAPKERGITRKNLRRKKSKVKGAEKARV